MLRLAANNVQCRVRLENAGFSMSRILHKGLWTTTPSSMTATLTIDTTHLRSVAPFSLQCRHAFASATNTANTRSILNSSKKIFVDRGVYEGDYLNGLRHGSGSYTDSNGTVYSGDWQNGQRHGFGVITYKDGTTLKGEYANDTIFNGVGFCENVCTGHYTGEFIEGKLHGQGCFKYIEGETYTGEWVEGKRHGFGTFTYRDGSEYVGDWVDGKKDGNGVLRSANGDVFEGEFKLGKRHGQGVLKHTDGSVLEGQWNQGKYITSVERTHRSDNKNINSAGPSSGQTAIGGGSGDAECGVVENSVSEAEAEIDLGVYEGGTKNGKWSGNGTITYANGEKFVGYFLRGKQISG